MVAQPRIRMITPVWGAPYIERWLGFCFASLRSDGNIPYLIEHCDFELAIVTKSADAAVMQASSRFDQAMSGIRVRFILMDEFFPRTGRTGYGVPLTLAYAKAIADLGDGGVGTFVMLMNADCVLASGSLESIVQRIRDGETIIVGQSLRAVDGNARDRLLARVNEKGVLAIAPRELMRLVDVALHSTVTARIVNEPGIAEANYYHQMFWRISDDCLAMRAFMLHPICFRIDRRIEKVVCPMDYGFLLELCPDGRFGVLDDSDDFLIVELQDRDSESHLLRLVPTRPSPGQRLPRLGREIAKVAATWTTAEHRRAATHTLYFHQTDLPSDLPQRVAPFDAFVDSILARMPRPVSHMGHPHWLAAVRVYRENMIRGGSDAFIALLDHPRNISDAEQAVPALARMPRPLVSAWQGGKAWAAARGATAQQPAPETELGRVLRLRQELGALVCGMIAPEPPAIDVVHIGNIALLAPPLPQGARLLRLADPSEGGSRRSFNVEVAEAEDASGTLVVYVTAGFLYCWDRLEEDLGRFLGTRRLVVLVFITDRFRPLEFATHSYLFTVLATSLPAWKFATTLEVYNASPIPRVPRRPLLGFMRSLARRARSALGARWPALLGTEAPPATFSALVVSVRPACTDLGAHRSTKFASAS
jgi:hypothetical protein